MGPRTHVFGYQIIANPVPKKPIRGPVTERSQFCQIMVLRNIQIMQSTREGMGALLDLRRGATMLFLVSHTCKLVAPSFPACLCARLPGFCCLWERRSHQKSIHGDFGHSLGSRLGTGLESSFPLRLEPQEGGQAPGAFDCLQAFLLTPRKFAWRPQSGVSQKAGQTWSESVGEERKLKGKPPSFRDMLLWRKFWAN